MGGLISLYAFFRHPEVFGFAGVMSPSLWLTESDIFAFMKQAPFSGGKLYLDVGDLEGPRHVAQALRLRDLLDAEGLHDRRRPDVGRGRVWNAPRIGMGASLSRGASVSSSEYGQYGRIRSSADDCD